LLSAVKALEAQNISQGAVNFVLDAASAPGPRLLHQYTSLCDTSY